MTMWDRFCMVITWVGRAGSLVLLASTIYIVSSGKIKLSGDAIYVIGMIVWVTLYGPINDFRRYRAEGKLVLLKLYIGTYIRGTHGQQAFDALDLDEHMRWVQKESGGRFPSW